VLDGDLPGRPVDLGHEAVHKIIGLRTRRQRREAER
jgi:hypothetical protein